MKSDRSNRVIIVEMPDNGIYDQIEAQRRYKNITQADLADSVGVTTRTYLNWLRSGTTESNIDKIKVALQNWPIPENHLKHIFGDVKSQLEEL